MLINLISGEDPLLERSSVLQHRTFVEQGFRGAGDLEGDAEAAGGPGNHLFVINVTC